MPSEISTVRRTLAPTTFAEAMDFSKQLAKSDMVPAGFRNKPENILLAIQWGMEVGLGPMQALQSVAVINGKPSVFGDALLGMVKGSPACEDVIERFEGSGDELAAICEAKRVGKTPVIARFSVADAKKAGLWGKQGPWQSYPRRMLQMRARGFALRDAFPDVLRGVITAEEAADYPVDVSKGREPIDITPKQDLDQFAASPDKITDVVDAETGEVIDVERIRREAREAAASGMKALSAYAKGLSEPEYAVIDELVGYRDAPGELRRIARQADDSQEDAFGLQPLAGAPEQDDPRPWLEQFAALDPADLAGEPDWPRYARDATALIERATAAGLNALRLTDSPHMRALRLSDSSDLYRGIVDAIRTRSTELSPVMQGAGDAR
jgi:hypothetical protein